MAPKIRSISVSNLQDMFDYRIDFIGDGRTAILIAPNGYGKTAFLSVINSCLQFHLLEAADQQFEELNVIFDDKTRWLFKKVLYTDDELLKSEGVRAYRRSVRSKSRRHYRVRFIFFNDKGKMTKENTLGGIQSIPIELLARALDRHLPVHRVDFDAFQDMRSDELLTIPEVIQRYKDTILNDLDFKDDLGEYAPLLNEGVENHFNCVFIETQRLLQTTRIMRPDADERDEPKEEIIRQSNHLAKLLQTTYASYAAKSQELDRSFPNRLIARSEGSTVHDLHGLKKELSKIEFRRKDLTSAGILDDTTERVIAPKDEFIKNVADALQIYVEDSKEKLATFDEVFEKISVFRDLMSKKLLPKELVINRTNGAEIRRGKTSVGLEKLSSGEKHEFIMLFRLIFETPEGSLVLIDEPEISFHVSWQLEFMSDLSRIQNANSFQSIIATHSPQIIQGADDITFDLSEQVR